MDRRNLALALAALMLGACGASNPASSRATRASQTPLPAQSSTEPLFAVLEARSCTAQEAGSCENPVNARHDTIALAGLDGFSRTKTTFSPRSIPFVGNAAAVLQLEAQVVGRAAYVVDGHGTVTRLEVGGFGAAATFPITNPQQEISFAVSPDAKQVMAAVLTFPDHHSSTDPSQPFGTFTGPYRLQLERAVTTNSGQPTVVKAWVSGSDQYPGSPGGFENLAMVGWDAQGPIVLAHAATGTQNGWLNDQRWFAGYLARIGSDGNVGPPIGPADCLPYWRPLNGRFVCTRTPEQSSTPISVVNLDGQVLWSGKAPPAPEGLAGDFALSPDGSKLAMDGQVLTLADNSTLPISSGFWPQGWLSSDTLIGIIPFQHTPGTIGILHLSDPQHPESWNFSGSFVGMLSTP